MGGLAADDAGQAGFACSVGPQAGPLLAAPDQPAYFPQRRQGAINQAYLSQLKQGVPLGLLMVHASPD